MKFRILETDFYQPAMAFATVALGRGEVQGGFEAFVRNIKPKVTNRDFYSIYEGDRSGLGRSIKELEDRVKNELQNPMLKHFILGLVWNNIREDKRDEIAKKFLEEFDRVDKDFKLVFNPLPKIYPFVPLVQYYGPIWIGQLLETQILNIVNGTVGWQTHKIDRRAHGNMGGIDVDNGVSRLMGYWDTEEHHKYFEELEQNALKFRASTRKILVEAAFRRAPNLSIANVASRIALKHGWNGTSNLAAMMEDMGKVEGYDYDRDYGPIGAKENFPPIVPVQKVGGTMAHSFIMGYRNQKDAFRDWYAIYGPNTTFLIDTYNTLGAIYDLFEVCEKPPACVRIDSEPLEDLAVNVRKLLDTRKKFGWDKTQIFLSGDLTPERLQEFEKEGIPFDRCMAGTKYVSIGLAEKLNTGFVYKIVQVEDVHGGFLPEKKSKNKRNKLGLKYMRYHPERKRLSVDMGFHYYYPMMGLESEADVMNMDYDWIEFQEGHNKPWYLEERKT